MGLNHEGAVKRPLRKPIPERLREAREARGFTLEQFAEVLDVSRQAVAQYETGQTSPGGDVMAKIIASTAQPPIFFVTQPLRSGQTITPFWRRLKRMELHHRRRITRRLEWGADIATFIEQFIHLPVVKLPQMPHSIIELHDNEEIERAAEKLRDYWGLGRGPIRALSSRLEENGFILLNEKVGCQDMDAVSAWQGGRPFVLFSSEVESGPRVAFNLAHELGHMILHAGVEVTDKNIALVEKQANFFAGALLLPRESFGAELLGTSLGYLLSLKSRWGVAISAMAYRAKELGIFNLNQQGYIMKQLNARGIKLREPLDDQFKMPRPSVLAESIRMLTANSVQTTDEMQRALGLNLADVESICGVPKGFLDTRIVQFQPRQRN
ncbi:MAG TPA: XRE family transcriptional regulator [Roseiarcus sp.]|nr:XRE family transcriptional regulator [Roseiarcus sp.]